MTFTHVRDLISKWIVRATFLSATLILSPETSYAHSKGTTHETLRWFFAGKKCEEMNPNLQQFCSSVLNAFTLKYKKSLFDLLKEDRRGRSTDSQVDLYQDNIYRALKDQPCRKGTKLNRVSFSQCLAIKRGLKTGAPHKDYMLDLIVELAKLKYEDEESDPSNRPREQVETSSREFNPVFDQDPFEKYPVDVIHEVFYRLGPSSRSKMAQVSRYWEEVSREPDIIVSVYSYLFGKGGFKNLSDLDGFLIHHEVSQRAFFKAYHHLYARFPKLFGVK